MVTDSLENLALVNKGPTLEKNILKNTQGWFFKIIKNRLFVVVSILFSLIVILNFVAPLIFAGFLGKVDFIDFNNEKSNKEVLLSSKAPFFVRLEDSNEKNGKKTIFSRTRGGKHVLTLPKRSGKIVLEYGAYFDYYTNKILSNNLQKIEIERDFDGPVAIKGGVNDSYDSDKNVEIFYFDKADGVVKMTPENPYCAFRESEEPDKTYKIACDIVFSNTEKSQKSKILNLTVQDELGNITYLAKDRLITMVSELVFKCNTNGSDDFVYDIFDKRSYSAYSNDGLVESRPFLINGKDGINCKSSIDLTLTIPELNNKLVYMQADKPAKIDLELKEGESVARTLKIETKNKIKKESLRYYNLDKTPPVISKYDSCFYSISYLSVKNEYICLYTNEKVEATYDGSTYMLNNQLYGGKFKANSVNIDVSGYYKDNKDNNDLYLVLKDQSGNKTTYTCTINTVSKFLKCADKIYQYSSLGAISIKDKGLSSFSSKGWRGDDE